MVNATLTTYGQSISSNKVKIDGFVLMQTISESSVENISSLTTCFEEEMASGNVYEENAGRVKIYDSSSNTYAVKSIVFYTNASGTKKAVAFYSSESAFITKTSSILSLFFDVAFSGFTNGFYFATVCASARTSGNNIDGQIHIEDTSTTLDDGYSVYSKTQVDSLFSGIPEWAKASSKPSYDLDEVSDGTTRKLSDYVPTTRTVNNKALTSNVTLNLDDVSDGSSRKLSDYVPSSRTVNSKSLSSNITLSLDDVADGSSRKLSDYETKINLKEGAYVDVDETTMTSSSTNIPTGKAVASYVTGLGYITSASLPTVNDSTITIKANADDTGNSFTTNASSGKTINLGLSAAAISGSYNDLTNKPTIPTVNNATLTIKKNDSDTGTTFTANASSNVTANLGLHTVATSGSYSDLSNKPTIPTVNNATLTIKKNSSDTGTTFTANASTDVTANLGLHAVATSGSYTDLSDKPTIPTTTSQLTNNSGFITSSDIPTNVSSFTNDAGYLTSYTETDPTVPSWAKESSKPSYDLDEVSDGTNRKLSNYVPTSRTVNSKALTSNVTLDLDDVSDGTTRKLSDYVQTSRKINNNALTSDVTLDLDDIADGTTRKLSDYVPTTRTVNSKALSSNITLSLDDVSDGSTRKLSSYELKSNLKEGAYVDVDETTMTSSSSNLPSAKAVASYIASLNYITSASLPTVNDSTITIKKTSEDTGDSFTTNASSGKTINLGLSTVATSGNYNDLSNKPSIPTVNNATLTIKKNNSDTGTTFTANASSDVTANLGLATVATSGSYNDLIDKPTIPSGGGDIDYLSLIGKSVTIGATGEVGVVYQPLSTTSIAHYEQTPNYATLNSGLVSDGWTLTNTWKTISSYISNNVIYYNGTITGGSTSMYYKTQQQTNAYTMDQINAGIVASGHSQEVFTASYNNSFTLSYGDPGYDDMTPEYNSRTYLYSSSTGKFTLSGYGKDAGTFTVSDWMYSAINNSSSDVYSGHWVYSAFPNLPTSSMDASMYGGSYICIAYSQSTYTVDGYSFYEYDNSYGYWHKTYTWNSQTNLPYGGTEKGYFIIVEETRYSSSSDQAYPDGNWIYVDNDGMGGDIYYNSTNSSMYQYYNTMSMMYGSDAYSCYNTFDGGSMASYEGTYYYYLFCPGPVLYAFINSGEEYSYYDNDYMEEG